MGDFKNISLDLETLDDKPSSALISIGAVAFNKEELGPEFYCVVDIESSIKAGGTVSGRVIQWWMKQSEAAREVFNYKAQFNEAIALKDFKVFCEKFASREDLRVWGNGATFDNSIIIEAFRRNEIMHPWSYKGDRCYRTYTSFFPNVFYEHAIIKHNALEDAKAQARHMIKCLNYKG